MLYVRGIRAMVRNDGIASEGSAHEMSATTSISRLPTTIRAGAVRDRSGQYGRVDEQYIRHGHEGGDARYELRPDVRAVLF
ncbi:MAG: hypothetical protein M1517_03050 [Deltaproteobacteria bacterium]|nr:hypothetical protein [Deltaproteobacteria bacterium]